MKPFLDPARRASAALRGVLCAVALTSLLAACGQKGPLYMPVRPAPLATTPAAGKPPATEVAPTPAPLPVPPLPPTNKPL